MWTAMPYYLWNNREPGRMLVWIPERLAGASVDTIKGLWQKRPRKRRGTAMSEVELRGVKKRYGSVEAIKMLDLSVEKGQFCALLGPSGCGKSTLLRMIAGLEVVTEGRIFIDGIDVTNVPPGQAPHRHGVPVLCALPAHDGAAEHRLLPARRQGAEGRRSRSAPTKSRACCSSRNCSTAGRRSSPAASASASPSAARSCASRRCSCSTSRCPTSTRMLRVQMRVEIAKLHQDLKATMIYVTHDQVEAMTLADKIVVLDHGVISQVGAPMELYHQPANKFVASFIGSPTMNFVAAEAARPTGSDATVGLPAAAR